MVEAVKHVTTDTNTAEPIEIVLGVYDPKGTYSVNAGVVMTSIFEHTQSSVRVHILHDATLTDDNREKFLRTAAKYDQRVEFHALTDLINNLGQDALALAKGKCAIFSIGTLFRLLIPEILAPDLNRVIYLDCDIIVGLDIQKLWEIDLKGNCIAGAWDHSERRRKRLFSKDTLRMALIGCCHKDYINTGVLLMDLNKIRKRPENMIKAVPAWFAYHSNLANLLDQDFLNAFFKDSILHISDIFNERSAAHNGKEVILHFNTNTKPWTRFEGHTREVLYWQMYLKSAWGEGITHEELLDLLAHLATLNPSLHHHSSDCWRWLGFRFKKDFLLKPFNNDFSVIIVTLIKEVYFRVMHLFCKKNS